MVILSKIKAYFHELFWQKVVDIIAAYFYNKSR